MATKKVYPFIHAKMFDLEDSNDGKDVVFDARELRVMNFGRAKKKQMAPV